MTTKIISGTITGGYTLAAIYSGVTVTSTGSVAGPFGASGVSPGGPGGVALTTPNGGYKANYGRINGGSGGNGAPSNYNGSSGGAGAAAIFAGAAGTLTNGGQIIGGRGGSGTAGQKLLHGSGGGNGGSAGDGVDFSANGVVVNSGLIDGGAAGRGGYGYAPLFDFLHLPYGGSGGTGGDGVSIAGQGTIINHGRILEGAGANGGTSDTVYTFGYAGGGGEGVYLADGTVVNLGLIAGGASGFGITKLGGYPHQMGPGIGVFSGQMGRGYVTNGDAHHTRATIYGSYGVDLLEGGTVTNFGTIRGTYRGIVSGGSIVNFGLIQGDQAGIWGRYSTVMNYGTIRGGVNLGGHIVNLGEIDGSMYLSSSGALINRGNISASGSAITTFGGTDTVINYGSIHSTSGFAVFFHDTNGVIVAEGGSSFSGAIRSTAAGTKVTLELEAGATPGTIDGTQGVIVTIAAGASWVLAGHDAIQTHVTLPSTSTLTMTGDLDISMGVLTNLSHGTLTAGHFAVNAGGLFQVQNSSPITNLDAALTLNGVGSTVESFSTLTSQETTLEQSLAGIGADGTLQIIGGRGWTSAETLTNGGLLDLGGGTFAGGGLINTGTITGYGDITAAVTNTGLLLVGAGQTLSLSGGTLTNFSAGTLTGGRFTVQAGGLLELPANSPIQTLDAVIELSGAGSEVEYLRTAAPTTLVTLEATLRNIGAPGALEIVGGRNWTSGFAVGNAGRIILGGGAFNATKLTNTGTIAGYGLMGPAIVNSGTIVATKGILTLAGSVTGAGRVMIEGHGTADLAQAFSENVTFAAGGGELELAQSQTYTGTITGFSVGSSLDLADIGFGAGTKAGYSGTTAGGVLSVTDGTHTANFHLAGNFTGSTFTLASDGHGGTTVVDPPAVGTAGATPLVSAMAAFAPMGGGSLATTGPGETPALTYLLSPRALSARAAA